MVKLRRNSLELSSHISFPSVLAQEILPLRGSAELQLKPKGRPRRTEDDERLWLYRAMLFQRRNAFEPSHIMLSDGETKGAK
jgi:hypothetical protein